MKKDKKILMLCSECFSTRALYNRISEEYQIDLIVRERPARGVSLVKRRLKKLGVIKVAGQIMFKIFIVPFLNWKSKKRISSIINENRLSVKPLPSEKVKDVVTVNDDACLNLIRSEKPDIVIVNGTRIISKRILESTDAIFINMHTGITPKYRGVHGGYWAVVSDDIDNCGVTVHLVDKGIDTGKVLYQSKIEVSPSDNFVTYPYMQFAKGIPLVLKSVEDIFENKLRPRTPVMKESRLWSHPTFLYYLSNRIFRRKK